MKKENTLRCIQLLMLGIFAIIFLTTTINLCSALQTDLQIVTELSYWFAIAQAGLLCLVVYYTYKWYILKKERA
jgi:hypothetical protein